MEGAGLASLEASNNPAVKRLLREARELREGACSDFHAAPLDDNLFEWHFTIAGPDGTAFEGGRYHGRITLPPEYPFKPPRVKFSTNIFHPCVVPTTEVAAHIRPELFPAREGAALESQAGTVDLLELKEGWSPALTLNSLLDIC